MAEIDLAARAELVVLSADGGVAPSPTTRHGMTVADAIRHVVEEVPPQDRPRAVVRTPTRLLFIAEIEALFDRMRANAERASRGAPHDGSGRRSQR
jgi:hypothetical protein